MCCSLRVVRCALFVTCCVPIAVYSALLIVVCWLLIDGCRLPFAVRRALFVVGSLL